MERLSDEEKGSFGVLYHFLGEGGEGQGEAGSDGVARRESGHVGDAVLWLDLLEGDWPG